MSSNIVATETRLFGEQELTWVLTESGRKAVRAAELIKALGKQEKDTSRLVQMNVFPDFRFQSSFGEAKRPSWYLYEQGAVQLATKLDTPECELFQRWVFDVVVKLFASGGIIMPTATSEQLGVLIKDANAKLMSKYRMRSVKFKTDKDGTVKMTVFRNGGKEYETYISDKSKPSLVNPQILIIGHYDDAVDSCSIDIDSPMKEAYVRWRQYDDVYDRRWKRNELEEWVRVNFPVAA
ncbi:hypothetical protein [Microcoleus sp. bin38.metabat.b11b12b14.051]|uniref:hypothetical protein n=1 Tax=Microcoleus sp. bin38.metabat.b11b12b14.051 TaxID=2742709 RepID=UPI0025EB5C89|nr:hypothetical protein [Microcoleus sp. bin38.metabat.b11b12b14.051]